MKCFNCPLKDLSESCWVLSQNHSRFCELAGFDEKYRKLILEKSGIKEEVQVLSNIENKVYPEEKPQVQVNLVATKGCGCNKQNMPQEDKNALLKEKIINRQQKMI